MQRPEAFKFRGNTGNTGYGFEQVGDDTPQNSDRGDGSYRFTVPGNRGSLVENQRVKRGELPQRTQ